MGWLGWPPDVVLNANIAHLHLAIAGKIDFVKRTNPWGSSEEKPEDPPRADPEQAQRDLVRFFQRQQSKRKRGNKR